MALLGGQGRLSHKHQDRRAIRLRRRTAMRAMLLAGVALMAGASSASAVIGRFGSTVVGYEPTATGNATQAQPHAMSKSASKEPLEYYGGPVMSSNTNYALYWDPAGAPAYPSGYTTGIDKYFEDLAHDSGGLQNTDSILTQYGDGAGEFANYNSRFGSALIDTDPYPANGCSAASICLTDAQLRSEITSYIAAHQLPTDLQHEYFLLTPPGVESCLEAAGKSCSAGTKHAVYCSYHGYISVSSGIVVYANIPYMDGTNCDTGEEHPNDNPSDATLGGGLVHEHSESVTDPELNAWHTAKKEEVADKCRTFKVSTEFGEPLGKAPDGSNYNEVIDGDLYWYQQMWSNAFGACAQRAALVPTVKKITPKSGPTVGGTSVAITGTGFVGTVTVHFGATLASETTVKSSTSITAVSPPGSAGAVDVTVTTSSGTSEAVKADHFKYKAEKAKK
jgi:IPT/TIG domain